MAHWLDGWLLDPKDLLVSTPSQLWNSKLIFPHPAFLIKKISIIIRTLNSVFMIVWPSTLPIANIECKNCVHLLEIANGKDLGCTSHGFHISADRYFFDMHTSTLFCLFWLIPVSFSVLVFISYQYFVVVLFLLVAFYYVEVIIWLGLITGHKLDR